MVEMPEKALKLQCTLAKEKVLSTQSTQLSYLLVEVIPVGAGEAERMPLNISFVLDRSGSMAGEKVANLREAVKLVIDQLEPDDIISIVIFDDRAEVLVPSQPASDKEGLKRLVDKITDRGGTEMSKGMRLGLNELRKNMGRDRVSRMVLLTDGQTFGDEDECIRLAKECQEFGLPIVAFGLGEDWNEELLDEVAGATSSSGGFSEFIQEPSQILMHFQDVLRSMKGTVAKNAYLTLRLVQGVSPRQVWRVLPLISNLGYQPLSDRDVQVPLGDIERDVGQAILVELLIPPRPAGRYRLAQAEVSYDIPSRNISGEKVRTDVIIEYTTDEAAAKQVNAKVMNFVEKATAFRLQTQALAAAKSGDYERATRLLRQSATRLLSIGEKELATVALEEAKRLEQGEGMSSVGTKRLRYETQRLTRRLSEQQGQE
ncbi:MAG: hypothetical protein RUDDFDWM_000589 [Candidatus Fervidibacterota bacterium]